MRASCPLALHVWAALLLGMLHGLSHAEDESAIRAAILRSLTLIERSSILTLEERPNCFTCHHTGLPVMTFVAARDRGFSIDSRNLQDQLDFTSRFLAKNRENYLMGKGQGGAAFTAGSALWALHLGGKKPDAVTEAVVEYLLTHQKDRSHWKPPSIRPPAEESPFSTTFVALEGLKAFRTDAQGVRSAERITTALSWLAKAPATNTEDLVFRLWSLYTADADDSVIQKGTEDVLREQRADGGWAQLGGMESDAYATGTALVALNRAGRLSPQAPSYQRGMDWLLQAQQTDGSWHVRSRSKPFQSYFESGYPHGKDQFISITAACWSTTALILSLPEKPSASHPAPPVPTQGKALPP